MAAIICAAVTGFFVGLVAAVLICSLVTIKKPEPKPDLTQEEVLHRVMDKTKEINRLIEETETRIVTYKCIAAQTRIFNLKKQMNDGTFTEKDRFSFGVVNALLDQCAYDYEGGENEQ